MRDLFPTRILLRVTEPEHVALTLGQGARDRGARADLIDEATPGVAYIGQDGMSEPVRVRFTHITDHHIADLTRRYTTRSSSHVRRTIVARHRHREIPCLQVRTQGFIVLVSSTPGSFSERGGPGIIRSPRARALPPRPQ